MMAGKSLRALRKRRGLTLKELGELCGVSGDELARYERGEKNPRQENTAKIAAALEESFTVIRDGVGWTQVPEAPAEGSALRDGVIQLLRETYGPVEARTYRDSRGVSRTYLTAGVPPDSFVLYESDITALTEAVASSALSLAAHMKDVRPEKEIIRGLLGQLDGGPPPEEADPHELTDEQWEAIRGLLPSEKAGRGRAFKDNRLMLNGILFWMRTGVPWRDLPKRYGRFRCVYDRLRLWNDTGVWPRVLERMLELGVIDEASIVVDSTAFRGKTRERGSA